MLGNNKSQIKIFIAFSLCTFLVASVSLNANIIISKDYGSLKAGSTVSIYDYFDNAPKGSSSDLINRFIGGIERNSDDVIAEIVQELPTFNKRTALFKKKYELNKFIFEIERLMIILHMAKDKNSLILEHQFADAVISARRYFNSDFYAVLAEGLIDPWIKDYVNSLAAMKVTSNGSEVSHNAVITDLCSKKGIKETICRKEYSFAWNLSRLLSDIFEQGESGMKMCEAANAKKSKSPNFYNHLKEVSTISHTHNPKRKNQVFLKP